VSNGTSATGWGPVSDDDGGALLAVTALAAIDRCGGHGGEEVPGSSDQVPELALKVPGLRSREEAAVRALSVRCARMTSQPWSDLRLRRICRGIAQKLMHGPRRIT